MFGGICWLPAKAGEIEARLRRYDGDYRWFLFRVEPVRDNHGKADEQWIVQRSPKNKALILKAFEALFKPCPSDFAMPLSILAPRLRNSR
jgi:hypothetical protein